MNGLTAATNYNFNLVAVPNISTPQNQGVAAGAPSSPYQSLLLLDANKSLSCSAGTINVNGSAWLNSTSTPAATLANNAQLNVSGGLYTASDPSSAISSAGGASYSPDPQQGGPATDPYLGLATPSASPASPPTGSNPVVFTPGEYPSTLSLNGFQEGILEPGTYILDERAESLELRHTDE